LTSSSLKTAAKSNSSAYASAKTAFLASSASPKMPELLKYRSTTAAASRTNGGTGRQNSSGARWRPSPSSWILSAQFRPDCLKGLIRGCCGSSGLGGH